MRYGDFVRIKNTFKSEGYLVSEVNFSGFGPKIMYKIASQELMDKSGNSLTSIFQIVPPVFSNWGKVIKFDGSNHCKINLRHFLSDSMLEIPEDSETPRLSESFSDFSKLWLSNIEHYGDILGKGEEGIFIDDKYNENTNSS